MKRFPATIAALCAVTLTILLCQAAQCATIRVSPTGNNANNGSTWALAKGTIRGALTAAASLDEIWVAAGTYKENITLKDGVALYGGFAGTETAREDRQFAVNRSILDGRLLNSTVTIDSCSSTATRIDGFTIQNGSSSEGGGLYCHNSKGTIANCVITGNKATGGNGGGVYCGGGAIIITNSIIAHNSAGTGGAVFLELCANNARIVGNTIADNSASMAGAVYFRNCVGNIPVFNNIVAFNSSGFQVSGSQPRLANNDVYSNTGGNYGNILQHATDISADPRFANRAASNYHLSTATPKSPCINAGSNSVPDLGELDIDGQSRSNVVPDIGADEVWVTAAVTITSPTADPTYIAAQDTLSIAGTAADGTTSVRWSSDRGPSGTCTGTTSWTAADIALSAGSNVITVTSDSISSTATDTLTVFYDAQAPAVTITTPTTAAVYTSAGDTLSIGGTATDDAGVAGLAWSNSRGGAGACVGTTTWIANGIALQSGSNIITVTVTDVAAKTSMDVIEVIYADTAPPAVSITAPTSDATYVTKDPKISLGGTATDNVAVTTVGWSNDRGGSGACTGTQTWTAANIALSAGVNAITVTASDAKGNTSSDVITVTCDTIAPAISITSPTAQATFTTTDSILTIGGTASDNVAIASVRWSNDRGGSGAFSGTATWSGTVVLKPGPNVIAVTAYDTAGNAKSTALTVTFTDTAEPSVAFTLPTADAAYTTNATKVNIAGTASDNAAVSRVTWSNSRGGSGTCSGTTSWTAANLALKTGNNVITVTATDSAGNTNTDTLTVTFTDNTAPVVKITAPTTEATYSRTCPSITIGGTATDNVEVTSVTWSSDRGGSGSCTGIAAWTSDLTLQPGENVITVSARDAAGNAGTARITMRLQSVSPGSAWSAMALVSVPIVPDVTDPKLVVGFTGNRWASFITQDNEYATYPSSLTWLTPPTSTPGRGFWASFDGPPPALCGAIPSQSQPAYIHLFPGWNIIGQPFLSAVDWDVTKIKVQSPGLGTQTLQQAGNAVYGYAWGWDVSTQEYYLVSDPSIMPGAVGEMQPWQGYWIRAKMDCILILPAP